MNTSTLASRQTGACGAGISPKANRAMPSAARSLLALLQRLPYGRLDLHGPEGEHWVFGPAQPGEEHASLKLKDWTVCTEVLRSGDIAFGEAYMQGRWTTPDLPALLRLLLANREALETAIYGRWWGGLLHRLRHLLNRNHRAGSRRNIQMHYDLGNSFYRLWLDSTMNYSSAWFNGQPNLPLELAQHAKVGRALDELGLWPGAKVLEIGCGWGAVAEAAARRGLDLTGVTLSTEQLAWAQERLSAQHLQADLRLQDYRDIPETGFDGVVSIEMFEAVGREYWPTYFRKLQQSLKPGGKACVQSIVIRDELFERYVRGTDFIQQYIFPGGLLPSSQIFRQQAQAAGLKVVRELAFGKDYAETLRRWRADFLAREADVAALGFGPEFIRMWDFYLVSCEAAFDAGQTSVVQFTLVRE